MPNPNKLLETLYGAKAGGAVHMQDGGDPTQMFNFNPMAAKAAKQKQMRESTPETPLGALAKGFGTGLFGSTEEQVPYSGSIMEGSPQRQQSQANLREIGRNVGALTDIGGMVTPFVKPATQAITRGATALGRTGLEQVDRAMFGEGPLASLVAPVAPLQAEPMIETAQTVTKPIQQTVKTAPKSIAEMTAEMAEKGKLNVREPSSLPGQIPSIPTPNNVQPITTVQLPSGQFATTTGFSTVKPIRTGFDVAETPEQVAHLTAGLRKSPQEQLVAVVVDENNKPIQIIRHTVGLINESSAEPFSLVGSIANTPGAKGFYISHNHPSGITELSPADQRLADYLNNLTKDTGLQMRGILAVGKNKFGYYDPISKVSTQDQAIPPAIRNKSINMVERTLKKSQLLDDLQLNSPQVAAKFADKFAGDQTGILLLNNQQYPVGFLPIDPSQFASLRKSGASTNILKALEKANSNKGVLITKGNVKPDELENIEKFFNASQVRLLDAIVGPQRESAHLKGYVGRTGSTDFLSVAPVAAGLGAAAMQEDEYKKGGRVHISNNPDTMLLELMNAPKMQAGGSVDQFLGRTTPRGVSALPGYGQGKEDVQQALTALEESPAGRIASGVGELAEGYMSGAGSTDLQKIGQGLSMIPVLGLPATVSKTIKTARVGDAITDSLRAKYPNVDISVIGDDKLHLSKIVVPKDQRNQGLGTQVMDDLVKQADDIGATVTLSPSADFGGNKERLKDFYKRFGFVQNKGRNKDFTIWKSMYRAPQENLSTNFSDLGAMATQAYADYKANPNQLNALRYQRIKKAADDAYVKTQATSSKPVVTDEDYRGLHTAPTRSSGAPLHALTQTYPDDIYSSRASQYYGHGEPRDAAVVSLAQSFKGRPHQMVTVYRAVPKNAKGGINAGDWVTIDRPYAKSHGESALRGDYKILSKRVRANEIFTNGDSIYEWGYDPVEAIKKAAGGAVNIQNNRKVRISDNPDTMRLELLRKKHA